MLPSGGHKGTTAIPVKKHYGRGEKIMQNRRKGSSKSSQVVLTPCPTPTENVKIRFAFLKFVLHEAHVLCNGVRMVVQGHPSSLILVPTDSAYATFYYTVFQKTKPLNFWQ